jgi:hypothetical protein
VRYEDLITDPETTMKRISRVLSYEFKFFHEWNAKNLHWPMLKHERHELLKSGRISGERIGIWKSSGIVFSQKTYETAHMMGYRKTE